MKTLHIISNAHLDPVWLWPVRDGMAEALTTIQSAVDRAAEFPQFKFTRSSAAVYKWIKEMDPVLYGRVRELIQAGRWEIIGGWVEQPDCNLPSTESFIRQGIEGLGFFQQEFGQATEIGYNVDSFGHAGGLPQILRSSGLQNYVFMRSTQGEEPPPPLLFWWESPDGSRVLTQRVPGCYSQSYATTLDELEALVRRAPAENFAPGFDHGVFWLGVGNHGGGPTREQIARIIELQKDSSLPELRFSTVADYLAAVRKEKAFKTLPVFSKEIGLTFRGTYSATGAVKALHRASEKALFTAESLGVVDTFRGGPANWTQKLQPLWWKLLFNEFHDILAGTCTEPTFEETRGRFASILDDARDLATKAAYKIARQVDTRAEKGSVLFAFNPLPWSRKVNVQLDTFVAPHGTEKITHLETRLGKKIAMQWMRSDSNFGPWGIGWGKLTAVMDLPPMGYQVLRVVSHPADDIKNAGVTSPPLTTPVTKEPALSSFRDAKGRELLAGPIGVVVLRDPTGAWGNEARSFAEELGRPRIFSTRVLEDGPLVSITRQKSKWRSSEIWMDVIRWKHHARVELRFQVNWQEKRQMAKLEISTRLKGTSLTCKTAGGVTPRLTNGEEGPCQDWVRLDGKLPGQPAALALLNDSSYSCSANEGNLRMVLTRSVPFAEHQGLEYKDESNVHFLDQGWQVRRFQIVADDALKSAGELDRAAQDFQMPAVAMLDSGHAGMEPWEAEFLQVEPAHVSVLAVKPARDGNGFIVRLQETTGRAVKATIRWRNSTPTEVALAPHKIVSLRLAPTKQGVRISTVTFAENSTR